MRFLLVLGMLGAYSLAAGHGQTSASKQAVAPFAISIKALDENWKSSEPVVVKSGQPVMVNVQLTNTSGEALDASSTWGVGIDYAYQYEVRDLGGNLSRNKPRTERDLSVTSDSYHRLGPGMSEDENVDLSRAYDMKEPGVYVIQVSRSISSDPKDGVVKSNEITVKVVPDATKE